MNQTMTAAPSSLPSSQVASPASAADLASGKGHADSSALASGKGHKDENFPVASWLVRPDARAPVLTYYRFARAADDIADNAEAGAEEKLDLLSNMRAGLSGEGAQEAMALAAVAQERGISLTHAHELLDAFEQLLPNPTEGNPPQFYEGEGSDAKELHAEPDPARHVIAHVFKVTVDPYVGKLGIFRIHQGTVTKDSLLYIGDGRKPFKVGHLFMLQGKTHVEVPRGLPGDICAVPKVDEMHFDAVLHDAAEDDHLHLKPLPFPVPVHGLAIQPRRRGDEQRMWEILQKLVDEDPCLKVEHVAVTNETVVYGLGELHLRTLLERMTEVYKCEVDTRPPRIAYRETITAPAEGHHRHKKQSGGAGQFGEVFLKVEPLPRGAGFEFVDQVKGGVIPNQFIPAVEKGVRQALDGGVIAGFPVKDVRVIVYDGKAHSVDSKEIAFATAGRKAFVEAVKKAAPIVLEPIVKVEISAPETSLGDITGDLSSRRGQVNGTDSLQAGHITVAGQVPLSELNGYQARLNGLTGGQGRYTLALSHYEAVPPAVQVQLMGQHKTRDDD